MNSALTSSKLVDLSLLCPHPILKSWNKVFEWGLGFSWLNREYHNVVRTGSHFFKDCLSFLNISYHVEERTPLPTMGGLLVLANHPFGAVEGLMLGDWLVNQRNDVKILANGLLGILPELQEMIIEVNPFGGNQMANARGMASALKWLKDGHVLLTFPAGEVSSYCMKHKAVVDPQWSKHMARMIRKSSASVLPVYIEGRNSLLFQCLGLLHPKLRSLLLTRELMNKRGQHFRMFSGNCWDARDSARFQSDEALIAFLRDQTYAMAAKSDAKIAQHTPRSASIVAPIAESKLMHDVLALPDEALLIRRQNIDVYAAKSWEIPNVLKEIGRLREVTFRASGEGSGKEIDLDHYDGHYVHLFAWDNVARCVIGAYRIGHTDRILEQEGVDGLYSHSLFRCSGKLLEDLKCGLELGRSFVRQEYQMSRHGLPLLWQAICKYVYLNPEYSKLYGCVSICSDYQKHSIDLMIDYCRIFRNFDQHQQGTEPISPYKRHSMEKSWLKSLQGEEVSPEELSRWVSAFEPDQKGIPVLLRHYLRLGARLINFNVDRNFSDVVDGLVLIDLKLADRAMVERFMGKKEAELYLSHLETRVQKESIVSA